MLDELGTAVTPERIAELEQHFMFRSDAAARDVGLILRAQQAAADLAAAERDEQARNAADAHAERARQFRRAADARDERDAARRAVERLVTAIGAALGAYDDWLHSRHEAASVARIIKPLTDALEESQT